MKAILHNVGLNPEVEAFAKEHFELVTPESMTEAQAAEIEVLLTNGKGKAPKELLDRLPNLKMIDVLGVGYDGVDTAECRRRGIEICVTTGVLTADVADLALGLTLSLLRRIPSGHELVCSKRWEQKEKLPLGHQMAFKRVGIAGLGQIGQAVAKRCAAFEMDISYFDLKEKDVPYHYFADLTELAANVDILIISAAATPANRGMVNAEVLKALGPSGVVVNVARGSLIDEPALIEAIKNGTIAGCALDVFEKEPFAPHELMGRPNVVLTPHIASATVETRKKMAAIVLENLKAFMEGRPRPTALPFERL